MYWNLGVFTRTREAASECDAFFQGKRLIFQDLEVPLNVSQREIADGWLVCAWPRGMSQGSPYGNEPRLTTEHARVQIARIFDGWLRDAPPFAAALFGCEAFDFLLDGVSAIDPSDGIDGFVVDTKTWMSLGEPAGAQSVEHGRFVWPRSRVP